MINLHLLYSCQSSRVCLSHRGSESGPGSRDPVPAEGDGERDGEEDLWNRGLALLLSVLFSGMDLYVPVCGGVWWTGLSCVCLIQHCLFVSDAAFLAREKARADAEYYTAAKFAEANRVKKMVFTQFQI